MKRKKNSKKPTGKNGCVVIGTVQKPTEFKHIVYPHDKEAVEDVIMNGYVREF